MELVGKTEGNTPVASGLFYYKDTLGLPWDVIILNMVEKDILIDWNSVIKDAIKQEYPIDKLIKEVVKAFEQPEVKGLFYGGVLIDTTYIEVLELGLKQIFAAEWSKENE